MNRVKQTLLTCTILSLSIAPAVHAEKIVIDHSASVAVGYNSNVYRSPDGTYIDWGQATDPVVNPNVQSGFFVPLKYNLTGSYALDDRHALKSELNVRGKFYLGSDLSNANQTKYKLAFGASRTLTGKKRRISTIEGGVFTNAVNKTYYDRDTGLEKTAGITDVADRYSYRGNGLQVMYKNKTSKIFQYGGGISIGSRDYTDTIANSQMDYNFTTIEGEVNYRAWEKTKLSASIEREVQDYDERPSRNLAGSLFASHPALEYTYLTLALGLHQKLSDHWTLHAGYKNIDRNDGWVNYNGYTAHKFKIRLAHKAGNVKTKFSLGAQTRDYPNAIAFDKPVNGVNVGLTYTTLSWALSREVEQTKNRALWGKLAYNNTDTNDLRYNYDRFVITAGYKWKF